MARLVLALRAAQVGEELQVRVGCREQESSDDGADRRVGPGGIQLRQAQNKPSIVLTGINLQVLKDGENVDQNLLGQL